MAFKRVVITGLGIISSIGNSYDEVKSNLKNGKSGVSKIEEWSELGIKSCIAGSIKDIENKTKSSELSRKILNCMGDAAKFCTLAAQDAIKDSGLSDEELKNPEFACIIGSGVPSTDAIYQCSDKLFNGKIKRISPYTIVKSMSSSCSASVTNTFGLKGRSYSLSSACATSAHNIGHAYELIKSGLIDSAITGGGEEVTSITTSGFMAMRMALSTRYIDNPHQASRPYDANRDGFVISGGAGILILEEFEMAQKRGAKIYGEIIGYHANADGLDMIMPDPDGIQTGECMKRAIAKAGISVNDIDYINTHGTSTVIGDIAELKAIKRAFGENIPMISSTKSMTGHPIAAAGALESIFCMGMLEDQFIAPNINLENIDPDCREYPIITETLNKKLDIIMNNNFGFGGTNATIIFRKFDH
ncbi:MAG: 3-oxoacyl-ACP synthase [Planctomycetota bacterium]|nr:MAG: 3-oxoacyl-ACP synthase [Planctomycetota bacterium]